MKELHTVVDNRFSSLLYYDNIVVQESSCTFLMYER